MKTIRLGVLLLAITAASAATTTAPAGADEYPSKAINVLVGFSAGGGTDVYARNLGVSISKHLNDQPFVVVNKAGGAQIPAMKVLKSSEPDGYTAMIVSMGSAIIATGLRDRGVDLFKDFELVAQYGVTNIMVAASKETGFKTPEDLIEGITKAHAKGSELRWGSAGRAAITTLVPVEDARGLARGFQVEDAPRVFGVSRVYVDRVEDLQRLRGLVLRSLDICRDRRSDL